MRQIEINELNETDVTAIRQYLNENARPAALEGMFWLPVPDNLLAEAQHGHQECGPFVFAIEVGKESVVFELLVRSASNLHCSCTSYATSDQRSYLFDFFDKMTEAINLKV